jgi:anti-sigma B factor antagonist
LQAGEVGARQLEDDLWVVWLTGEHDVATVQSIRRGLRAVHRPPTRIAVDLSGATFVGSTTVGALWDAYRYTTAAGGRLMLVAPPGSRARRLIDLTGFGEQIPVVDDLDHCLAALRA